jgi:hypothetical protein
MYAVRELRAVTDQEGQGQEVAIPRGYRLRPVEAVQTWLAAAEKRVGVHDSFRYLWPALST